MTQWEMVAVQDQQQNEIGWHEYWLKLEVYGTVLEVASLTRLVPE